MKMFITLMKPTNGVIEIFGRELNHSSYEVLKRMGC